MYGVGGRLKTTFVSPCPSNHCGLCRSVPRLLEVSASCSVLLEEHRNLEDDFRKFVSAFCEMTGSTEKPPVLRQSTGLGRIQHFFHMKVDSDLEVDSCPALFARAAVFNAPDNLFEIFDPCQPVDLWPRVQKLWHSKLHRLEIRFVKVRVDALWKAVNVMLVRQRRSWT